MTVRTGLDVIAREGFAALAGQRVGLLTNPSAVDRQLVSAYRRFAAAPAVDLRALFSPEHGFAAAVADGEHVASTTDARTGVPVYSLYGETLRPTADMLADVDVVVCDIQDIGARFYTFIWTVALLLEAAGEHDVAVMILDRPNPLGDTVVGPLLDMSLASPVGYYPVPIQHGMTIGEFMQMANAVWNPTPCALTVIPCEGYTRGMTWEETGLPFVPPSPNMPAVRTVRQYPGACLIEGTTLSEGRGTANPFEITGAPFITDAETFADTLNALNVPGVRFRPHYFQPAARKFAGEMCGGVQVHITGAEFDALQTWLSVIVAVRRLFPSDFGWHPSHFDRLIGSSDYRQQIDDGATVAEVTADFATIAGDFRTLRQPYLIYT